MENFNLNNNFFLGFLSKGKMQKYCCIKKYKDYPLIPYVGYDIMKDDFYLAVYHGPRVDDTSDSSDNETVEILEVYVYGIEDFQTDKLPFLGDKDYHSQIMMPERPYSVFLFFTKLLIG